MAAFSAPPYVSRPGLPQGEPDQWRWLASLVASAGDAIVSTDLHGVIASWNQAAHRLLGYTEAEALGASIAMLGEDDSPRPAPGGPLAKPRLEVYRRKDGSTVAVSVTTSAVYSEDGELAGLVMVARDVSTELRVQRDDTRLIADMHHRMRNLFTLAGSVVALSARFADTPADLARQVRSRLVALSRATDLTLSTSAHGRDAQHHEVKLHALVNSIVASHAEPGSADGGSRVVISGPDLEIAGNAVTHFALLLNEMATNSAKKGALSRPDGTLCVDCSVGLSELCVVWREEGELQPAEADGTGDFDGQFSHAIIAHYLNGTMTSDWTSERLVVRLALPLDSLRR